MEKTHGGRKTYSVHLLVKAFVFSLDLKGFNQQKDAIINGSTRKDIGCVW